MTRRHRLVPGIVIWLWMSLALALDGKVEGPDGKPIAGATVVAHVPLARDRSNLDQPNFVESKSSEDGTFSLELPNGTRYLWVSYPGSAPSVLEDLSATARVAVRLERGLSLHGSVVALENNRPIEGASLLIQLERNPLRDPADPHRFVLQTRSNVDGHWALAGIPVGQHELIVRAAGRATRTFDDVELSPLAAAPPIHVALEPGLSIRGTVRSKSGEPIVGADVSIYPETNQLSRKLRGVGSTSRVKSAKDGSFHVEGLLVADEYSAHAAHPDFAKTLVTGLKPSKSGAAEPVVVTMTRGASLEAQFIDRAGRSYSGEVLVTLHTIESSTAPGSGMRHNKDWRTSTVGSDGKLKLERLDTGDYQVTIGPENGLEVSIPVVSLREAETATLGTLTIDPGLLLRGLVTGPDGAPRAGIEVSGTELLGSQSSRRLEAKSSEDGSFSIAGLRAESTVTLDARDGDLSRASTRVEKLSESALAKPVSIALQPILAVTGRVVAGDPPLLVPRFGASLVEVELKQEQVPPGFQPVRTPRSRRSREARGRAGQFRLETLEPGRYRVRIEADGFMATDSPEFEVNTKGLTELAPIVLRRGQSLRVRVTEKETGAAVMGATVVVTEPGMSFVPRMFRGGSAEITTDTDGYAMLTGLAPGQIQFDVGHDRFALTSHTVMITAQAEVQEITVQLPIGGAIEGVVLDSSGAPVVRAMVMAHEQSQRAASAPTMTDQRGFYRIERLPAGSYTVGVTMLDAPLGEASANEPKIPGRHALTDTVVVSAGSTTIANFPKKAALVVRGVLRRGGKPLAARMDWKSTETGPSRPCKSDTEGRYEIELDRAGHYGVAVQMGVSAQTFTLIQTEVPATGAVVLLDLDVPDKTISGTVRDAVTGTPIDGASVGFIRLSAQGEVDLSPRVQIRGTLTDSTGNYSIPALSAGKWRAIVEKPGFGMAVEENLEGSETSRSEQLDFMLQPAIPIRFRFVSSEGSPITRAGVIEVRSLAGADSFGRQRDSEIMVFESLGAGTYDFIAYGPGYAPQYVAAITLDEKSRDATTTIALEFGASVELSLKDEAKQPVARARLEALTQIGSARTATAVRMVRSMTVVSQETGAEGRLILSDLPTGRYEALLVKDQLQAQVKFEIKQPNTSQAINVVMKPR